MSIDVKRNILGFKFMLYKSVKINVKINFKADWDLKLQN